MTLLTLLRRAPPARRRGISSNKHGIIVLLRGLRQPHHPRGKRGVYGDFNLVVAGERAQGGELPQNLRQGSPSEETGKRSAGSMVA